MGTAGAEQLRQRLAQGLAARPVLREALRALGAGGFSLVLAGDEELACAADNVSFFKRDFLTNGTDKQYENERKNFIDNIYVGNSDYVLFRFPRFQISG